MSRYFLMSVEVRRPNPVRIHEIEVAAINEWPFTEWNWSEADKLIKSYAESSLCGGEDEAEFADRLTKAIWKANDGYCQVLVYAMCLDDLPINLYELKKDDFANWSKADGNQVASEASSGLVESRWQSSCFRGVFRRCCLTSIRRRKLTWRVYLSFALLIMSVMERLNCIPRLKRNLLSYRVMAFTM